MSQEVLQVKKLSEFAILPTRGSKYAAGMIRFLSYSTNCIYFYSGFDLSSAYDCVIPRRGKGIVKTDLSIAIPPETYARIGE